MSTTQTPPVGDDSARIHILDAIKAAGGTVTVADVVARSGVPPADTERLLNKLVLDYESALDVDDNGDLLYRFDPALSARQDIVDADKKRRRRAALRDGFMRFFRVWTVAMVVVYTVIFALFIIAIALRGANNINVGGGRGSRTRRGGQGASGLAIVFNILASNMTWRWNRALRQKLRDDIRHRIDRGEDPFRWRETKTAEEDSKPSIIDRTWYWLFGSAAIETTPLELEKTLITYVRAKKGLITNADIMALTGETYDNADAIGTRLCAAYGGELDITEDGIAVYRFKNLMLSAAPEVAEQVPRLGYLWQSRKHEHELRQNPSMLIPGLNAFNLVLSIVMYTTILPQLGWMSAPAIIVFSGIPLVFSTLFFLIGGIRMIREAAGREEYERDNLRIAMYRLIFAERRALSIPGDERLIGEAELGWWRDKVVIQHAPAIAQAIRGKVRQLADGRTEISAQQIIDEITLVEQLRQATGSHLQPVGQTVFSSEVDDFGRDLTSGALEGEIAALSA